MRQDGDEQKSKSCEEVDSGACNEKLNKLDHDIEEENHDRAPLSHCENDCVNEVRLENEADNKGNKPKIKSCEDEDSGACNEKLNKLNHDMEDEKHDRGLLSHYKNDGVNDVRLETEAGNNGNKPRSKSCEKVDSDYDNNSYEQKSESGKEYSHSDYDDDLIDPDYEPKTESCKEESEGDCDTESDLENDELKSKSKERLNNELDLTDIEDNLIKTSWVTIGEFREDDIERDVNLTDIYIRRIKHSDTATGRQAKNKKDYNTYIYNNYHACFYCGELRSNLEGSKWGHYQIHRNIPQVNEKFTKEKTPDFSVIRKLGDHRHNVQVLKNGQGEVILSRRPPGQLDISLFGPCPKCKLWLLLKNMRRHYTGCSNNKKNIKKTGHNNVPGRGRGNKYKTKQTDVKGSVQCNAL